MPLDQQLVVRAGNRLVLANSGAEWRYAGVNNYYLAIDNQRREVVDEIVSSMAAMGLTVLRTWAFNDAQDKVTRLQGPRAGEFIDENFVMLDYALDRLAAAGMRAILVLTNNWPAYGGLQQYVAWSGGTDKNAFYRSDAAQRDHRRFVERLVTRVNTVNGRQYLADPAILAWQVCNEPRNESEPYEGRGDNALTRWINGSARFLKRDLGVRQLVGVGIEGFYADGNARRGGRRWMDAQGTDFIEQHAGDDIDLAGFHVYPDHWKIGDSEAEEWITAHVRDARERLAKPVIMDEFGRMRRGGSGSSAERDATFDRYLRAATEAGASGTNFWMLSHTGHPDYDTFTVYHPADVTTVAVIRAHADRLRHEAAPRLV